MCIRAGCHQCSREQEGTHSNRTPRMRATAIGTLLSSGFDHIRAYTQVQKRAPGPAPPQPGFAQHKAAPALPLLVLRGPPHSPSSPRSPSWARRPSQHFPSLQGSPYLHPDLCSTWPPQKKAAPWAGSTNRRSGEGQPLQIGLTYADGLQLCRGAEPAGNQLINYLAH